jgi:2-haloalkanoic acid dehalogenase type II
MPTSEQRRQAPLRVVSFDLDGTLWDAEPALTRAERAVHHWLSLNYPPVAQAFPIEALRELRRTLALDNPHLAHDVTALRKESIKIAAERVGVDPQISEQAFQVFMLHRNCVRLYADVLPALARLRTRYLLCSLTNGNADLVEIGLQSAFHHSLSAAEVGAAKPASEMFARVCALAGVSPAQIVHVGDEPETDMFGAATAGCRTVWINRRHASWTYEWRPDAEIDSLTALEEVLLAWEGAID